MAQSKVSLPPGPNSSSVWQLLRYSHSPLDFLEQCARRYGDPFTIRQAGYGNFVMLAAPDAVKEVFRGDSHSLHSGEGNEFLNAIVGTNSVLVLDDELHARQRQVLLPPLKVRLTQTHMPACLLFSGDGHRACLARFIRFG